MGYILVLLLLLIPSSAVPLEGDGPSRNEYAAKMDKANIEFMKVLVQRLTTAGYRDVQIIPQMFIALVRKRDGSRVSLIVDSNTMQVLEMEAGLESSDDRKQSSPETDIPNLH